VIVAAIVALIQLESAKSGKPSVIAVAVTSTAVFAQEAVAGIGDSARGLQTTLGDAPNLYHINATLRTENAALAAENARLREALAEAPDLRAILEAAAHRPGIVANTVGFDPESATRSIVIDRGGDAGVRRDMGVIDADGVVGRVVAVEPQTATVLLVTDGASKVPAVVQRGRFWGIATGTGTRIRMQYVSQDAKLKRGDPVVTGEGRSFHAGLLIGRVARVDHPDGALYQTAIVEPAVAFGRLAHVLVLGGALAAPQTSNDDDPAP
jgi:rod shape-determining protein MreC